MMRSDLSPQAGRGKEAVIASEATKQSIYPRGERRIASLAMRKHTSSFPRRDFTRVSQSRCPSLGKRAQGKPGADCARSPVCESATEDAHGLNYRYSQDIPAFPAQWFYGFLRALPGERPFLPPSPIDRSIGLTPGSRRQDHTTSPYAAAFSSGGRTRLTPQRPSQPAPTLRDDRANVP
jgi:hypothetical protein